MGMYTELNIGIEIEANEKVINILKYMLGDIDDMPDLFDDELFKTDRWEYMLRSGSYYFDGQTDSKLFVDNLYDDEPMYFLNVRSNLKNYCGEIEKFLDWICKYCKTEGFIGYKRYEESERPDLIYVINNGIKYEYV